MFSFCLVFKTNYGHGAIVVIDLNFATQTLSDNVVYQFKTNMRHAKIAIDLALSIKKVTIPQQHFNTFNKD